MNSEMAYANVITDWHFASIGSDNTVAIAITGTSQYQTLVLRTRSNVPCELSEFASICTYRFS